jgi:hypothetical protein
VAVLLIELAGAEIVEAAVIGKASLTAPNAIVFGA